MSYTCKYCSKAYVKESTLAAHQCEPKRRALQEKETGVQFGLKAYLRFYEMTQGSSKLKTYDDFVASPYYIAFVKFGRYLVSIRVVNSTSFIDWLLKNNKKLDYWTKEAFYLEWLADYMKKENVQDAMERALKEMEHYAEYHPALTDGFADYFRLGHPNRICQHIANGRISPWVVYNCASGVTFLGTLGEEQIGLIIQWIDPDFWKSKFADHSGDTDWVKHILEAAGL